MARPTLVEIAGMVTPFLGVGASMEPEEVEFNSWCDQWWYRAMLREHQELGRAHRSFQWPARHVETIKKNHYGIVAAINQIHQWEYQGTTGLTPELEYFIDGSENGVWL